MKRFRFRLQKVLDYRDSVKKQHERDLAFRNQTLFEESSRLELILGEQEKHVPPAEGVTTMAELGLQAEYQKALIQALVEQRMLVLEAAEAVEAAREAYIERAVEAETLHSLRDSRRESYIHETAQHDKKALNEIAIQRANQRKKL